MIGGIVLAAGAGLRFGSSAKQLAELGGRPLLEHAIRSVSAVSAIDRVVVVLGARADEIRERVDFLDTEPIVCPDWERGLSASLRCGIEALLPDARTFIVTLGDQPFVTPQVVARFVDERGTCRAGYDGRPGHPVRMTRAVAERARALTGDAGARDLLRSARLVECGHLASDHDIDTPPDLEEAVTA